MGYAQKPSNACALLVVTGVGEVYHSRLNGMGDLA